MQERIISGDVNRIAKRTCSNARQLRAMCKFHVREGQKGRDQMRPMYFIYF